MYFESLAALWAMDGHGVYVWTVYAIALLIICSQIVSPLWQRRRFWQQQAAQQRRLSGRSGSVTTGE